ncbi:MAG: hypothetical protein V1649_01550 [Patescibacteria group bacterium]
MRELVLVREGGCSIWLSKSRLLKRILDGSVQGFYLSKEELKSEELKELQKALLKKCPGASLWIREGREVVIKKEGKMKSGC